MTTPFFTLIVAVHGVQAVIRDCMDSILSQSFVDLEVIAVDDCSPDHAGAILDAYADIDPRLTVLHLDRNVGLGPARQAGLTEAVGRYVLFVDGDDWLTPGALQAMADRLDALEAPDVLIFDYERVYWDGRRARNQLSGLLSAPGSDVFAIGQREDLLRLLMVVWNKAYRRDFLAEHGFAFGPGFYEDLPWTYPTLLSARRIAVLDRVCVSYRQRRTGSILRTTGRKHFDVFEQYERIFRYLDDNPEVEHWRGFLVARMMEHLATILARKGRLESRQRPEFFRLAHAAFRRHGDAAGYVRPTGLDGLAIRAIEAGSYATYAALQRTRGLVGGARVRAAQSPAIARRAVRVLRVEPWRRARLLEYLLQLRLPIEDDLAVFASYWFRAPACNPLAIARKTAELAPQIRAVWVVSDAERDHVPPGIEVVSPGSRAYYRAMARARVLVNNVNFPTEIKKRPGTLHVATHHGTPLKLMGLDLMPYPDAASGMNFQSLMKRCDRWDLSLSSNAFSSEVWERAYPARFTTFEAGYPRNDVLVDADGDRIEAARRRIGIEPGGTTVLYATTHRDYHDGHQPVVDVDALADALGPDVRLLVRTHYFYGRGGFGTTGHERVLDVSAYPTVEDLYLVSDVLVTDYSSVMFDFATLDRPIVLHIPDWERYRESRGTYFDITRLSPGPLTTTAEELADVLGSGRYAAADSTAQRAAFRALFCQFDDGRAAERVVRTAFLGGSSTRDTLAAAVVPAGEQSGFAPAHPDLKEAASL